MSWSITSLRSSADDARRRIDEAVDRVKAAGAEAKERITETGAAAMHEAERRLQAAPPPPPPTAAANDHADQAAIDFAKNSRSIVTGRSKVTDRPQVIPGVGQKGSAAEAARPYVMVASGTITGYVTGKLGVGGAMAQRGLDHFVDRFGTAADKTNFGYGQLVAGFAVAAEGTLLAGGSASAEGATAGLASPVAVPVGAYGIIEIGVGISHVQGATALMASGSAGGAAAPSSTPAPTSSGTAASAPTSAPAPASAPTTPSKPSIDMDHVMTGGINKNGRVVGYHSKSVANPSMRAVPGTKTALDANGVYEEKIEAFDPKKGTWVAKKRASSFFPDNYSRADIDRSIHEAFEAKTDFPDGTWKGRTKSGILVEGYADTSGNITTAYPVWNE